MTITSEMPSAPYGTLRPIARRAPQDKPACPPWCEGKWCFGDRDEYEHEHIVGEFTDPPLPVVSVARIDSPDLVAGEWVVGEPVIHVSTPESPSADDLLNLTADQALALATRAGGYGDKWLAGQLLIAVSMIKPEPAHS